MPRRRFSYLPRRGKLSQFVYGSVWGSDLNVVDVHVFGLLGGVGVRHWSDFIWCFLGFDDGNFI